MIVSNIYLSAQLKCIPAVLFTKKVHLAQLFLFTRQLRSNMQWRYVNRTLYNLRTFMMNTYLWSLPFTLNMWRFTTKPVNCIFGCFQLTAFNTFLNNILIYELLLQCKHFWLHRFKEDDPLKKYPSKYYNGYQQVLLNNRD